MVSIRVPRPRTLAAGALLLLLLPAVPSLAIRAASPRTAPAEYVASAAPLGDPFHALLARSRDLGSAAPSQTVAFLVRLRDPLARRRVEELAAIYTPSSKSFGHYQTARYESAPPTVRAARAFLSRLGMTAVWEPGSSWLVLKGPAQAVERVFQVRIHDYVASSGRRFYAAAGDPLIPRQLAGVITGTGHISSYPDRQPNIIPADGLRPRDLLTAYDITPLRSRHLDGSGETIAFIEIDGFRQADLNAFTQHFSLPAMHPTIAAGTSLLKVQGEAELDLEIAHEIAPGARLVVYNCSAVCTNNQMLQLESQAVRVNERSIISISLGGCEQAEGAQYVQSESNVFAQADALGETVLVASGDTGAYTCLEQDYSAAPSPRYVGVSSPASDPNVTAVGGSSLDLNANSTWYREQAWQNSASTSGSGGGMSAYFSRPSWQRGPGALTSYDTKNRREVPDIAGDADPLTGAQVVISGQLTQVGGTSQATPIWAAMMALIDQYLRKQGRPVAGFLNPALYSLAAGRPAYPPFHDITQGDNLLYPATPGFDLATGLGTPDAWNLARDLATYEGGKP